MAPRTVASSLATEERLTWLRKQLNDAGAIRLAEAAQTLKVSEMTIRRDLQELEANGIARRVRGGAVAVGPLPFASRHRHRARAKARIASKLQSLIPTTGALGLDASSTMLRVASGLEGARELTVLTNGLETFHALQGKVGIRTHITGGELDARTGSLVGPIACRSANQFLLSAFFMSAACLEPVFGASEATFEEAEVKRALAQVSAEVVLAVDSTKLGMRAVAIGVPWESVTMLVTELENTDKRLDAYRDVVQIR